MAAMTPAPYDVFHRAAAYSLSVSVATLVSHSGQLSTAAA